MSNYDFTVTDVVAEVRKLAAEEPDFIYTDQDRSDGGNCSYLGAKVGEEGGVGCIVGQALTRLGVSRATLLAREEEGARHVMVELGLATEGSDDTAENAASYWLAKVQGAQDRGDSWSEAVRYAGE